ncbi:MAG: hypothetical protein R3C05_29810 [Pirellulaceae bacterium]
MQSLVINPVASAAGVDTFYMVSPEENAMHVIEAAPPTDSRLFSFCKTTSWVDRASLIAVWPVQRKWWSAPMGTSSMLLPRAKGTVA